MAEGGIREGFLEEETLELSLKVQRELSLVEGTWMKRGWGWQGMGRASGRRNSVSKSCESGCQDTIK